MAGCAATSATLLCSTGTYPRVLGVPVPDLGGARSSPPGNDTLIETNNRSRISFPRPANLGCPSLMPWSLWLTRTGPNLLHGLKRHPQIGAYR